MAFLPKEWLVTSPEDLMVVMYKRLGVLFTAVLLSALLLSGCSDDGTGPKEALAPLVGVWTAESLVLTNQQNPGISVDLIATGATFTLSILSTGQYSASLSAFGQANTEVGTVTVSGDQITITPTTPPGPAISGAFYFQGETLVLDGESEFDFNQDGILEAALVHLELVPRDM